jgi:selenocysteine lyase/cysteine desulfurase
MNDNFRKQFPALQRQYNNDTLVFLDGPGGTQVPTQVIDAVSNYYKTSNANAHGLSSPHRKQMWCLTVPVKRWPIF